MRTKGIRDEIAPNPGLQAMLNSMSKLAKSKYCYLISLTHIKTENQTLFDYS